MTRRLLSLLALLAAPGLSALAPMPLDAQSTDSTAAETAPAPDDAGGLPALRSVVDSAAAPPAYYREVFRYPQMGRVDPVTLPASVASRDAFPELTLTGIVFDEQNPAESAAIVRVQTNSDDPERRVVRAGDMIDQYEIASVERDRVAIDIHLLGTIRRMYLARDDGSER